MRRLGAAVALLALAVALLPSTVTPARAAGGPPFPVLAYYYIWYSPTSWSRAKVDYPLLGNYSSDERTVMRQHVTWAKEAGIDGFIVSWKSTPQLNARLARLIQIADQQHFKLAVIYQGLDFERKPLPITKVRADLEYFADTFAPDPAFQIFRKPLLIWSGTWEYSPDQIRNTLEPVRRRLFVLASERDPASYGRLSHLVDGNAYYWSSASPYTYTGYQERLDAMGRAVHRTGGLWVAPAAPGFDARLVGGTSVVPRRGGETLRRELAAAYASSPDALGLISWNEFSENSHVEPSRCFGREALATLADVLHGKVPNVGGLDSNDSSSTVTGVPYGIPLLLGIVAVAFGGIFAIAWRRSNQQLS